MDIETQKVIDEVAQKAAADAVAKMREFHQDDLKVLGERMDIGFESVNRKIDTLEIRFDTLEIRFDTLETRFDTLETRFDTLETRFENQELKLDRLEDAFSIFLKEFKADKEKVQQLEAQVVELVRRVTILEAQLTRK